MYDIFLYLCMIFSCFTMITFQVSSLIYNKSEKSKMTEIIPIILAGGFGARLWPLSRTGFARNLRCILPPSSPRYGLPRRLSRRSNRRRPTNGSSCLRGSSLRNCLPFFPPRGQSSLRQRGNRKRLRGRWWKADWQSCWD